MKKILIGITVVAVAAATNASLLVARLSGAMSTQQGTVVGDTTITAGGQTLTIHQVSGDKILDGVYILGSTDSVVKNGTNITVLNKGSSPLIGALNQNSAWFQNPSGLLRGLSIDPIPPPHKIVPMTSFGVLNNSVAFTTSPLTIIYPSCALGPYTFPNGIITTLLAFPTSYSIPLPSIGLPSRANVIFPSDLTPRFDFEFLATNASSQLNFFGFGASHSIKVQGEILGSNFIFPNASFQISGGR